MLHVELAAVRAPRRPRSGPPSPYHHSHRTFGLRRLSTRGGRSTSTETTVPFTITALSLPQRSAPVRSRGLCTRISCRGCRGARRAYSPAKARRRGTVGRGAGAPGAGQAPFGPQLKPHRIATGVKDEQVYSPSGRLAECDSLEVEVWNTRILRPRRLSKRLARGLPSETELNPGW